MKKLAVLCIAALGAALLVLGTAPSASAYPEVTCEVTVSHQVVKPGQKFTVTGKTPIAVDAKNQPIPDSQIHWTFNWNGVTKARDGREASVMFTAPKVKKTKTIPLTVRNTNPVTECVRHFDITVIGPKSKGPTDHGLPNTGGPTFWLLVAGLVLLLGGGGAVAAGRRRNG